LTNAGLLTIECPAGCAASFRVPVEIVEDISVCDSDGRWLCFGAVAPRLHDVILRHLKTCPSASSWLDNLVAPSRTPEVR
jgi:hypothetical protein